MRTFRIIFDSSIEFRILLFSYEGLVGAGLYRCGNAECGFSASHVSDFRDHVAICEFSVNQMYLACRHCDKQFKHVPTLLEHLKTHGVRRYD